MRADVPSHVSATCDDFEYMDPEEGLVLIDVSLGYNRDDIGNL